MKNKIIASVILASMLATGVCAAPVIEGLTPVAPVSAYSSVEGAIAPMFDGKLDTMSAVTFVNDKTASVNIAGRAPFELGAVAASLYIIDGDENTEIKAAVYGSMDGEEFEKIEITIDTESVEGYTVFTPAEKTKNYNFYKIEIASENGATVGVAELCFYRPDGVWQIPVYDTETGKIIGWTTADKTIKEETNKTMSFLSKLMKGKLRK